ncbi:carbohydrate binding domain-containing protein [Paenibacillus alkalitolerans]|uniref:carbohydrate binding domain-containing protein n=1 Tax=Paenibacillus alkalitolerans TaxID=2799335 RepID=UPI001F268DF4|nr:carbohydrate binding domain-containing protein [Paenibacillus alkalitolerans]
MIGADHNPAQDVKIDAFKDPATGNFAIVAINRSENDQKVTFQLNQFPNGINELVPYRTSGNENLKKLEAVEVVGNAVTVELKGSSVTTYVPKSSELPDLDIPKDVFSTYEAEENDGQSADFAVSRNDEGKSFITNVQNGDYVKYGNVNFADGTANGLTVNGVLVKKGVLAMNAHVASLAGGTIEVRLDDPVNGKAVGTMTVPPLNDPDNWITVSTMIDTNPADGANGIHDMYLVFKGGANGQPLFNADGFSFGDSLYVDRSRLKTEYDFEDGTKQGWFGRSSANVLTVTQEQAQSGLYSLKTTNRTSAWHGPIVDVTEKIVKGTTYEISGYVRLTDIPATPSSIKMTLEIVANGTTTFKNIAVQSVSDTNWYQLKAIYNLTSDVSALKLYVESSNRTESYYIDNIVINPLSNNAKLSGLELSAGTLSPNFSASITGYNATVSVESITVTPVTAESHATVTVNGAAVSSGQASQPVQLVEGENIITVLVTAQDGTTKTYTLHVTRDINPPVTTAALMPAQPDGLNGWYVQPVTVTLNATDDLSAVTSTVYSLDGGTTWQAYAGPVTLNQDSNYTFSYRSTDHAGNEEIAKSIGFNLDTTAPTVTVSGLMDDTYSTSMDITPNITLNDSLSGVDSGKTTVTLNGDAILQGEKIPLYTLPLGSHRFVVTATDMAGNTVIKTVAFNTATNIKSLQELVTRFANAGWIDNAGIANSLQVKLEANNLSDFISEIQAQSGKLISNQAANYLIRDAQYLITQQ